MKNDNLPEGTEQEDIDRRMIADRTKPKSEKIYLVGEKDWDRILNSIADYRMDYKEMETKYKNRVIECDSGDIGLAKDYVFEAMQLKANGFYKESLEKLHKILETFQEVCK